MTNGQTQAMARTSNGTAIVAKAPVDLISFVSFEEAVKAAQFLAQSTLVPADYIGKPANIIIAMDYAARLNSGLMAVMQGLAVINGRPTLWGDLMIGLVLKSDRCEYVHEHLDPETMVATCKVKRVGMPESIMQWSPEDARLAGLWGKKGPWTQYPKRMLTLRARAWALRNNFADVLLGLQCAEEVRDYSSSSAATALREPETVIEVPMSDKYIVEATLEDRPVMHNPEKDTQAAVVASAKGESKGTTCDRPALGDVLHCINSANTIDELRVCKTMWGDLPTADQWTALEAAKARKLAIEEQALELAADTARRTEAEYGEQEF